MQRWVMPWCLGLVLATATAACGNPCDDLVNTICGCNSNDTAIQACKNRVSADTMYTSPTAAQKDTCSKLNDTCTCNALACGDFAACGLAKNDPNIDLGTDLTCH